MSGRRRQLWARAGALDAAPEAGLSPRARRLAQRMDGLALDFDDLAEAPDWAVWPAADRARLERLAGAVAVAPAWRRSVDGATLRRAGAAVGEAALDAVLALPDGGPDLDDAAAVQGDADALQKLGRAALLGELAGRPALAERLSRLIDARPWPQAAPAAAVARGLFAQMGAA